MVKKTKDIVNPPSAALKSKKMDIPETFINKQRVLVFGSRGLTHRFRHLLDDLRSLLPHSKKDVKMDEKDSLSSINEIAEIKSCNNTIFFEVRKQKDLYMWVTKTPLGPSLKFHVTSVHTMDELKLTGNCLMGSRPLLTFDGGFEKSPELRITREVLMQVFGTPKGHPKSKPFFDHVFLFSLLDDRIWFRNYQIAEKMSTSGKVETILLEIGPRFVMNPIRILEGSFQGRVLYDNPLYISPNAIRSSAKRKMAESTIARKEDAKAKINRLRSQPDILNPLRDLFANPKVSESDLPSPVESHTRSPLDESNIPSRSALRKAKAKKSAATAKKSNSKSNIKKSGPKPVSK